MAKTTKKPATKKPETKSDKEKAEADLRAEAKKAGLNVMDYIHYTNDQDYKEKLKEESELSEEEED